MKKILLAILVLGLTLTSNSQILLSQDFQGFADGGSLPIVTEPDDAEEGDWISFDFDALSDGSPNDRPGNWYGATDLRYFASSEIVDTNFVMASSSWMEGFAPGNRNWFISPPVEITGPAVLNWSSSVFQTPRYADGYSVWISPNASLNDLEEDFSDFVFRQAQMVEGTSWNSDYYGDIDYANCIAPTVPEATDVCWFPEEYGSGTDGITGYRHAADHTLTEFLDTDPEDAEPQAFRGLLEPHAFDLSDYVGQTIRIAWLHDSDDDNLLAIDDILVELATGIEDIAFKDLVGMYPNPTTDVLNLSFSNFVKEEASVTVFDVNGKAVLSQTYSGAQLNENHTLDVVDLAAGLYNIQVRIDNSGVVSQNFLKQ